MTDKLLSFFEDLSILVKKEREKQEIIKETRATFIIRQDQLEKIKTISFQKRKLIKDILEESLYLYLKSYEEKNGKVLMRDFK